MNPPISSQPFLSVIIPVYNVESYLSICLDSLFACNFSDWEIIVVTGQSTDSSNIICQNYAEKYSCIRVLQQSEKGLSNARNCGLAISRGEYVLFVDSDDYIDSEILDKTIQKLREVCCDVVVCDFQLVNTNNEVYSVRSQIPESDCFLQGPDVLVSFLKSRGNYWNVWRYIYKSSFLFSHNLTFKENYKSEDIDYSTRVLLNATNIAFFHSPFYCYRVRRDGSLVNVITLQNVTNLMDILDESICNIQSQHTFPFPELLLDKLLTEYLFSFLLIRDINPAFRAVTLSRINEKKHLLCSTPKGKALFSLLSITGISSISYILYFARALRRKILKIM